MLLGVAAWLGVVVARPVSVPLVLCGVAVAMVARRDFLFILTVGVLASSLSARAEAAFEPAARRTLDGQTVELVTDPKPFGFGVSAEARIVATGERTTVTAAGPIGSRLGRAVAGERLQVSGRLTPMPVSPWSKSRHLVGRISVDAMTRTSGVAWFREPSEWLRTAVRSGARTFDDSRAALYLGLVIGDDRFQSSAQEARFRQAGLTHLLAVSGQNVAFALAVAGPILSRLSRRPRLLGTIAILIVFAIATRLEPSVLRATMTAGVSALAVANGSRSVGIRSLAMAVTALLLVDPFLAGSVGFQLSVGASVGILLLAPSIRHRLRGPRILVEPTAVTIAAQVGVLPILLGVFGPVSLVTLPANVLAGWAAGAVMTLGLSAGLVAGLLPEVAAMIIQWPSLLLLRWIEIVAARSASLPAPLIDGPTALLVLAVLTVFWLGRSRRLAVVIAGLALAAVLTTAVPASLAGRTELAGGGSFWPSTDETPSVLIVAARADDRLVSSVLASRIGVVDVVLLESGSRTTNTLVMELTTVLDVRAILAPSLHRVVGARRLIEPLVLRVADGPEIVELRVEPGADRLELVETPVRAAEDRDGG